jgi:uncharacterized membrane protein YccC
MATNKGPSPWLELVQRWERAIGEPIEGFVRSDAYFDLMTQVNRARGRLARSFEDVAAEWLHFFNIPAASDVRRLREQLSRLERQVNSIAKDLADWEEARQEQATPTAKPRARRTAKAKSSRTSGS